MLIADSVHFQEEDKGRILEGEDRAREEGEVQVCTVLRRR